MFEYDRLALDVAEQFAQIRSNAVANSPTQGVNPFVSLVNFSSAIYYDIFTYDTPAYGIVL